MPMWIFVKARRPGSAGGEDWDLGPRKRSGCCAGTDAATDAGGAGGPQRSPGVLWGALPAAAAGSQPRPVRTLVRCCSPRTCTSATSEALVMCRVIIATWPPPGLGVNCQHSLARRSCKCRACMCSRGVPACRRQSCVSGGFSDDAGAHAPACSSRRPTAGADQPRTARLLLWDRVMRAALDWFARPPSYFGAWSPADTRSGITAETQAWALTWTLRWVVSCLSLALLEQLTARSSITVWHDSKPLLESALSARSPEPEPCTWDLDAAGSSSVL